ncbi:hypothetical protein SAMN04488057_11584 [Cyclobacterium lianum]|uniref:Uncharacterized protein n=1 Tax=Cyclobacterium lianum TaxID=388280 RepID=A0A1M7Q9A8_9BACT|nr:hypothetical protein [Cyclobacterium lianum]SHN27169.1 hypothetical protein SAMN04488057_11584 [Cyclobacterium lianum]
MRAFLSILLLSCFLVYHFGFYVFHRVYQFKIEQDWAERVYQEDFPNKKILKIPMKLPYAFEEEGFQLTNIPFSKEGKAYRAIQKRFKDDTFELVYVPDMAKIKLEIKTRNWVLSLIPENRSDSQNDQIISQATVKDYIKPNFQFEFLQAFSKQKKWKPAIPLALEEMLLPNPSPPPRWA